MLGSSQGQPRSAHTRGHLQPTELLTADVTLVAWPRACGQTASPLRRLWGPRGGGSLCFLVSSLTQRSGRGFPGPPVAASLGQDSGQVAPGPSVTLSGPSMTVGSVTGECGLALLGGHPVPPFQWLLPVLPTAGPQRRCGWCAGPRGPPQTERGLAQGPPPTQVPVPTGTPAAPSGQQGTPRRVGVFPETRPRWSLPPAGMPMGTAPVPSPWATGAAGSAEPRSGPRPPHSLSGGSCMAQCREPEAPGVCVCLMSPTRGAGNPTASGGCRAFAPARV